MLEELDNIYKEGKKSKEFQSKLKKYVDQYNQIVGDLSESDKIELFTNYCSLSIKQLEYLLKLKNKEKQDIVTKKIVNLFNELGIEEVTTEDGQKVKIDTQVSVKTLDKDNRNDWLINTADREDLIKTNLSFAPGDFTEDIKNYLAMKATFSIDTDVNTNSLKALIKRRMLDKDIPHDEKYPPKEACKIDFFDVIKIK